MTDAPLTPEAAKAVADKVIAEEVVPKKIPAADDIEGQTAAIGGALATALLTCTDMPIHTLTPVVGDLAHQLVALGIRQTDCIDPAALNAPPWITDADAETIREAARPAATHHRPARRGADRGRTTMPETHPGTCAGGATVTTPGGVPNLPQGALTLATLAADLQDMSVAGMRGRANGRIPTIFNTSTGGDVASDLSPLGIIAQLFSGFNSVVANADPADINGPEDLPGLLIDFIEGLPLVAQFIDLLDAIKGTYTGDDPTLLIIQEFFANLRAFFGALDFFDPAYDAVAALDDFINTQLLPSGLFAAFTDITAANQALRDNIWSAITRLVGTGITSAQLEAAFQNFPAINIPGTGGPVDVPATFQETWFQLISGVVDAVGGTVGTVGLSDLFNTGHDLSSRSTLGMWSWDILGIRGNKPMHVGILPSSEVTIPISDVAFTTTGLSTIGGLPVIPITQSTALTAWQTIGENTDKFAIQWLGAGVSGLTDAYVNVKKMDTATGDSTLIHTSPNVIGLLSDTMQFNLYVSSTAMPVTATDVIGIELAVRGAGTHNVVGKISLLPAHPTIYPNKVASVRNSGTTGPPSTIPHTSLAYSNNVMAVEFATGAGVVGVPHSPEIKFYGTAGTDTIPFPLWANICQVQAVGAGGGGRQGGTFGFVGEGGAAGVWATGTWVRGVDFAAGATPTITRTVTAGGSGGSGGIGTSGGAGGNTTVSIPGHTVVAAGGAGGSITQHSGRQPLPW